MAHSKDQIKKLCKGRTREQQTVIKYFLEEGGCLNKGLPDEEYDNMLREKIKSLGIKNKALGKIGLDESQVNEIKPVNFEWFVHDDKNYAKIGKDGKWRSSKYQISWIFFSDSQVYVYQYTFNMNEDGKNERTEEYFYQDIVNFSTRSDEVEKEVVVHTSCKGDVEYGRKMASTDMFSLVVPGDKFDCSMLSDDSTDGIIQGMKAKLREKKTK